MSTEIGREKLIILQHEPETLARRLSRNSFTHADHGAFDSLATKEFLVQTDKDKTKQGRSADSDERCDAIDGHSND